MAKDIQRSIRFSRSIFDYVDNYRGEGFSNKFENMVIDAMEGEQRRAARLAALDRQIAQQVAVLESLQDGIDLFRRLSCEAGVLEKSMSRLISTLPVRVSQAIPHEPAAGAGDGMH